MKLLTMTEQDEAEIRDALANGRSEHDFYCAATNGWAEVDALRAKLAETERRAAASQARERALREKGAQFWGYAACGCNEPDECVPCAFRALLLATPTDDSALRGLMMQAVVSAEDWASDSSTYHGGTSAEDAVRIRNEIVDRVLGPERTDAADSAGKEG